MYTGLGATQQQIAGTVGSSLLSVAQYSGPAAPFVAAAGALADIVSLFGPNPSNEYATEVVNQVEADVMKPNLAAWQSEAKTSVNQQAALQNFISGWTYVMQSCNNPQLGSAGTHCISDRQRGGKFDWWASYYDPIANDPNVSSGGGGTLAAGVSSLFGGSSLIPLLLLGAVLLAVAD
jgi:hypothetical protein